MENCTSLTHSRRGGSGGELCTCLYPLKVQARPPRDHKPALRSRVPRRDHSRIKRSAFMIKILPDSMAQWQSHRLKGKSIMSRTQENIKKVIMFEENTIGMVCRLRDSQSLVYIVA